MSEYGVKFFGQDYGRRLISWIMRDYRAAARFGQPPFEEGTRFGIQLLVRRGDAP